MHRLLVIMTVALALAAGLVSPARAAAPSHDGPGQAKAVAGIGFADSVNVSQATAGPNDPAGCSNNASVWYRYRATATETINVNTSGSNYDTVLGIYTGRPGAFTRVKCVDDAFTLQAATDLRVESGRTYHFMVAACCGRGRDGQDFGRRLVLRFHVGRPLVVEQLTVADTGTVSPTADGDARLTTSSLCDRVADRGRLSATLQQRVGEIFVARGSASRSAQCGTSVSENTVRISPEGDVTFAAGPATVTVRLIACSRETGTCTRRRITGEVVLALP
jgi:hypothetical protein